MSMMERDQSAIVEISMFLFVARLDDKIRPLSFQA